MSQQQQQSSSNQQSASPKNNFHISNYNPQNEESQTSEIQHDDKHFFEKLYNETLIRRLDEPDNTRKKGRKNKNEILCIALARLIKGKYLNGFNYSRDVELTRGIQIKTHTNDFVLVLRTDGRIVIMTDTAEQNLGKSMRLLYAQCINIFQCLDKTDGAKLRSILKSSSPVQHEYQLICTFRLPKGKRPSRIQEDTYRIYLVGHFYNYHNVLSSHEKLFIAHCEVLLSRSTHRFELSQQLFMVNDKDNINSILKFILNEDMSISLVSPNVKNILGYQRNELIGNWFGRYLPTNDLDKFETINKKYCEQYEQQEQQKLTSVCDIFDIYTINYGGRLTFLCQIQPILERRVKSITYVLTGQLIDPSLRNEYVTSELETNTQTTKAAQVNHNLQLLSSTSRSKMSDESVMTNGPALKKVLCNCDNTKRTDCNYNHEHLPSNRPLSNTSVPIDIDNELWQQLFTHQHDQQSTTIDLLDESTKLFDDILEYQSEQRLEEI